MAETMHFSLVTPEKSVFEVEVKEVTVPAYEGEMQALPLHTPYFAKLGIGILSFTDITGENKKLAVTGGFVEVLPHKVTMLCRTAELPEEIDAERAMEALKRAKQRLEHPDENTDIDRARAALMRAMARLKLVGKIKD